jgi:hypothetical protein
MYCNIENYVMQHQNYVLQYLKQKYCNIAKTSVATTQKSHGNIRKTFVATIQKSHCNIRESSFATSKKTHCNTRETGRKSIQKQLLAHHLELVGGRRE